MNRDTLYAFAAGERVGEFVRNMRGQVSFSYEDGYAGTPISLSLPLAGLASSQAAANYLDGLLPDDPEVRAQWQKERSLVDSTPFTLLKEYGQDASGALSFSASPDLPHQPLQTARLVSEEELSQRAVALAWNSTAWRDPDIDPRFTLGGAQGKFPVAREEGEWRWPTYSRPSTHIFKPPSRRHRHIEIFEHAALVLAREVGIPSAVSHIEVFGEQPTFVVERWDRHNDKRLFAEDLNQALGNETALKYSVSAPEIARLLAERVPGEEWEFTRQLAFNVSIGNADAHAKNYSLLTVESTTTLAPLYDSLPTFFYPQYNARFAMPIGSATLPGELSERNWRMFARDAQLDEERVLVEAFTVMSGVAEKAETVFCGLGIDQHRMSMLRKHVKRLQRNIPS